MKPRNDRERLVVKLSEKMPAITKAQEEYCFRHCFEHYAIKRKKADTQFICLECGGVFEAASNSFHQFLCNFLGKQMPSSLWNNIKEC